MEKGNFVYSGWRANGFVALVGLLVLIAGGIALCVLGSDEMDPRIGLRTAMLVCGVCLFFISMFCFRGFMLLEPNEARVVMFFGKYKGTFYETGFWWINPFMGRKKISVRARNLNVEPIKVNDKNGNPVMIGLVLVWKIRPDEIYRAVFDIDASTMGGTDLAVSASARMKVLENFVSVQSDAALRQVAGYYADDNNGVADDELTLRSNSDEINDQLEAKLNDRLSMAGIEVIEARINYLAYAPEIAAVMLRRQQADAIISAREKIVEGAVTMVKMALDRLADDRIVELDEERKAAMEQSSGGAVCRRGRTADRQCRYVASLGSDNGEGGDEEFCAACRCVYDGGGRAVGCGRVPQHQRPTAVDHHGSSAQKRPPEKITGRETGAETRKRVNLCESVLCGGVPAATAGSLGSGENGSK